MFLGFPRDEEWGMWFYVGEREKGRNVWILLKINMRCNNNN